jgi:hypothetical protein
MMTDRGTPVDQVDLRLSLYEGGYGLDSMDAATFSAMLDERFEDDPYSGGQYPRTLGDIVAYYSRETVAG